MSLILNLFVLVCLCAALALGLTVINILQAGGRRLDGRSMEQILGVDPETAIFEDIEKLSRKDKLQLFHAATAPEFGTLSGEYEARLLSGGVLGSATAWFTHHIFPAGRPTFKTEWVGKSFQVLDDDTGKGYNLFTEQKDGTVNTRRIREMKTSSGPTKIGKGGKPSFHLDYSPFNSDLINSMRDEIRQVNANLFIGAGHMTLGGGPLNPAPFALIGPAKPWVGPDPQA